MNDRPTLGSVCMVRCLRSYVEGAEPRVVEGQQGEQGGHTGPKDNNVGLKKSRKPHWQGEVTCRAAPPLPALRRPPKGYLTYFTYRVLPVTPYKPLARAPSGGQQKNKNLLNGKA